MLLIAKIQVVVDLLRVQRRDHRADRFIQLFRELRWQYVAVMLPHENLAVERRVINRSRHRVVNQEIAVEVDRENHVVHRRDQRPELFFTPLERLVRVHPLRNVARNADDPVARPVTVDQAARAFQPDITAIRPSYAVRNRHHVRVLLDAVIHPPYPFNILWVDELENAVTNQRFRLIPQQQPRRRRRIDKDPVRCPYRDQVG